MQLLCQCANCKSYDGSSRCNESFSLEEIRCIKDRTACTSLATRSLARIIMSSALGRTSSSSLGPPARAMMPLTPTSTRCSAKRPTGTRTTSPGSRWMSPRCQPERQSYRTCPMSRAARKTMPKQSVWNHQMQHAPTVPAPLTEEGRAPLVRRPCGIPWSPPDQQLAGPSALCELAAVLTFYGKMK